MSEFNTYTYAILSGIIIYAILEIDRGYFNNNKDAEKYSSIRISLMVASIVWCFITYNHIDVIPNQSTITGQSNWGQQDYTNKLLSIRTDPFF
jgi:hypothetical protein